MTLTVKASNKAQQNINLLAEIQIYMTCFGVTQEDIFFQSLCRSKNFPESLSLFEDEQLQELHDTLESRWESLPLATQNQRVIVNSMLLLLGMSWKHESIIKWVKKQKTPFTELNYEQLQRLAVSLQSLEARRENNKRQRAADHYSRIFSASNE
jgi:hypothetical protein